MKKVTVYKAEDGTEHETKQQCLVHELKANIGHALSNNVDEKLSPELIVDWIIWNYGWIGDEIAKTNLRRVDDDET